MVKKKILIVEGNTREENSEFTAVGINTHTESLIESINFYENLFFEIYLKCSSDGTRIIEPGNFDSQF